jgi:2'-5' RNA ligase
MDIGAKGYSIWLIPEKNIFDRLQSLILKLSKRYNTPAFDPHVTLAGGLMGNEEEIIRKTILLADKIYSFNINLSSVLYMDNLQKCLFIEVSGSKELITANENTKNIFKLQKDSEFLPHLSLIYGQLPEQEKKEIVKMIGQDQSNLNFKVNKIHLFLTNGDIESWRKIKEIPLK